MAADPTLARGAYLAARNDDSGTKSAMRYLSSTLAKGSEKLRKKSVLDSADSADPKKTKKTKSDPVVNKTITPDTPGEPDVIPNTESPDENTIIATPDEVVTKDPHSDITDNEIQLSQFIADEVNHKDTEEGKAETLTDDCLLYTSPSPRDVEECRMPSSA